MSVTVITEDQNGSPQELTPNPTLETVEEVAEIVAETSLEIAQTEAARDIAIAEIHAETAIELATVDAQTREDEQWLRERLASTQTELALALSEMETMRAQLLAQSTLETAEAPEETMEIVTEEMTSPSIQSDISQLTNETPMEVIDVSESAREAETVKVELPPLLEVKRKPTIRLV